MGVSQVYTCLVTTVAIENRQPMHDNRGAIGIACEGFVLACCSCFPCLDGILHPLHSSLFFEGLDTTMRLWNEYEGTTIAGIFPVEKLIRPEGRSAFFSTTNGTGTPGVLRLIESINDEAEILKRWQTVASLNEISLITLKKFGQTTFEGTPLIYLLMEPSEADLATILQDRPLTADETRQIATSLVDALEALHASNFVHEHVEAANVMATAGDMVKLRSDCVREAPEGEEGIALKKQDVHDLSVVLLQALTQQKSLNSIGSAKLPTPFDMIIRNGISGTWGLAQIASVLNPPVPVVTPAPRPLVPPLAGRPAPQSQQIPLAIPQPAATPTPAPLASAAAQAKPATPSTQATATPSIQTAAPHQARITVPLTDEIKRRRLWMAIAPAVIVVASALGWYALHRPASGPGTQPVTTLSDVDQPAANPPSASNPVTAPVAPVAVKPDATRPGELASAGDESHRWHVVAYTYYRQDQAQHKADQIQQRDPSLHAQVFSPTGRAPYLVTLGGPMTRADAAAFRQRAASAGLPRDIYIQNYNHAR
jgi:hypothetical protein